VQVLDTIPINLFGGMEARLRVVRVGQQKITGVLIRRVELFLGNRRNLCLALRRLGILLDFLRADGPVKEPGHPEHSGASNIKSIHISRPDFSVNRHILR
jgi:hypothetical protein